MASACSVPVDSSRRQGRVFPATSRIPGISSAASSGRSSA
jgi:hypothetical protein